MSNKITNKDVRDGMGGTRRREKADDDKKGRKGERGLQKMCKEAQRGIGSTRRCKEDMGKMPGGALFHWDQAVAPHSHGEAQQG